MKHPAQFYLKFLLIRDADVENSALKKDLLDNGFLTPDDEYLNNLRDSVSNIPIDFEPMNKLHRPSMQFLRDHEVYELFYPNNGTKEAWQILSDPYKRSIVEQALMNPEVRRDLKQLTYRINKKYRFGLTEEGIESFNHFFWNTKLLTIDQWSKYFDKRSSQSYKYMGLVAGTPELTFFHLRLDQVLDSKKIIQRTQEIAYFTLEEVSQTPGVHINKVKSIGILSSVITDCHNALSTSDVALTSVLKDFERWRMDHIKEGVPSIKQVAPSGNYSGGGGQVIDVTADKVEELK